MVCFDDVWEDEFLAVLEDAHSGISSGYFVGKVFTCNIS